MKKKIIITETGNGIKIEQFCQDGCGDWHEENVVHNEDIPLLLHKVMKKTIKKHEEIKHKKERHENEK